MSLKVMRHDVGDKFGFIKATVEFAFESDDLKIRLWSIWRGWLLGRGLK